MGILNTLGDVVFDSLKIRRKPKTIQLPITSFCNSKCETCNVWKIEKAAKKNIDINKLVSVLQDPYLNKVENVGINGGEPFLHPEFDEVIRSLCVLPDLKRIYLITNGIATSRILEKLESTRGFVKEKGIEVFLTVSYDGIEDDYSAIRGVPNGYEKVLSSIKAIQENKEKYCDGFSLGITISNQNISQVAKLRASVEELGIPADFHLAVPNRRIGTENDYDRYSVLSNDRNKRLATQFFFGQFKYARNLKDKLKYFQNYYYLKTGGQDRISACQYKYRDITIDEGCNLYYCAKESQSLGIINRDINEIIHSDASRLEHERICSSCSNCGHYIAVPTFRGLIKFAKECLSPGAWVVYRVLAK